MGVGGSFQYLLNAIGSQSSRPWDGEGSENKQESSSLRHAAVRSASSHTVVWCGHFHNKGLSMHRGQTPDGWAARQARLGYPTLHVQALRPVAELQS